MPKEKPKPTDISPSMRDQDRQLHQLSNSLGAVWGYITLLQRHLAKDPVGVELVECAATPLKQALNILGQLQDNSHDAPPITPSSQLSSLMGCEQLLLIEDDPDYREMLSRFFVQLGYHVHLARDAEEALQLFDEEEFDLVLLDHQLPEITGLELAQTLRTRYQKLRMILLSGELFDPDSPLLRPCHFYSVLTKTSSLLQLGAIVRESLDAPPPTPPSQYHA